MNAHTQQMKNNSAVQLLQEIERLQSLVAELQCSEIERKRAEQINQTLFNISNAVNTTFNLDQLYRSIHKALGAILDVRNFYIAIYHQEDDSVTFPYFVDEVDHIFPEIKNVSQSQSLTGEVIRTGKPLLITKQEIMLRYKKALHEELGTPAEIWIGVPLKIQDEVIGVIAAQSYTDPHQYSYHDIDVLMSVSDQVAIAIERQCNVELLKASEQRYRNLVENIDGIIFATDERGIFTYISPAVKHIIGYSQEDILGKIPIHFELQKPEPYSPKRWRKHFISGETDARNSYEDIIHVEDRRRVHDVLDGALQQLAPYKIEYRIIRQDDKVQWVYEKGLALQSDHHEIHLEGVILDIQERKYAEEINQTLFSISNAVNMTVNLNDLYELIHYSLLRVVDVSNFYIALYDKERDLIQFPYNTDDVDTDVAEITNASQSDSLTSQVIHTGKPLLLTAQEHEILKEQRGMDIVGIPSAVWLGVPLIVNGEVIGAMVAQHYTDSNRYDRRDVEVLCSVSKHVAIAIERKKAYEDLRKAKIAAESANQELIRVNQQLEQAMTRANEMATHAKNATRSKSAFLANMSHEIRTPMNAIIGLTSLMLETQLTDKQRDYLNKIHRSSHALLDLMNDILDFSKIEAGKLSLEQIEFRIHDLIDILIDMFAGKAAEKGIELIPQVAPEVPLALVGDPLRLRQILINLTNNALKFTNGGEVVIKVDVKAQCDDRVQLVFSVSDTGIGIPDEQISNLFDSFVQGDGSTSRQYGGTGLGLAICKRLVEIMQGNLWVESCPGQGSTFGFTVEFGLLPNKQAQMILSPIELQGLRVLVVDDNSKSRELLKKMLTSFAFHVTLAKSGKDALQLLENAVDKPAYHLILLDLMMPDMDGINTITHIRKNPYFEDIPIILLLVFGREDMMQQARAAGANGFLMKPLKQSSLFETIMELFAHKSLHELPNRTSAGWEDLDLIRHLKGAHILLVEDSSVNQHVTVEILKKAMVSVDTVNNGLEALHAIRSRKYDLVLMDIQMPVMDGYQTTQEIRKDPGNSALPIIAFTAYAMKGDREKCLNIGMNDYLSKPIVIQQLFSTLARWIPSAAQRELDEQPVELITLPNQTNKEASDRKKPSGMKICTKRTGHEANIPINFTIALRKLNDLLEQRNLEAEEYFMLLKEHLRGEICCANDLQCLEHDMSNLDFDHAKIPLQSIASLLGITLKGQVHE
ncbi:putative two-component system sensor protein [Candidatus Vecturithrix granuli]|uniref:Sensory/regulatory protein RpfC n=1 Tax=Vecturithrix granuli TaxID=1499967 RepID=A0A081BYT1_VECG1|nr:putative two-component system sensor protein [Candidatus Vecturithrix granuli]